MREGVGNRVAGFASRRWPHALILATVLVSVFFLVYGLAAHWGSSQWGSYGQCVGSGLTFAAVVVALRESFKGDRARRIDHELTRRRECIDALAEMWGGIAKVALVVAEFVGYLRLLPPTFDPDEPLENHPFGKQSEEKARAEIQQEWLEYMTRWNSELSPSVFKVFTMMRGTPLDEPLLKLKDELNSITSELGEAFMVACHRGERPDLEGTMERWGNIVEREGDFISLARHHFGLSPEQISRGFV